MNMNDFRQHLQNVNGSLYQTQKNISIKDDVSPAEAESPDIILNETENMLLEFSEIFKEDAEELSENHINEAISFLEEYANDVFEYLETGNEELEHIFDQYMTMYFGDSLNENLSDEDMFKAIVDLVEMCDVFDECLGVLEGSMGQKRLLRKAAGIVKAKKRLDNLNRNSDKAIAGGPTISHSAENKARDVLAGRAAKTSSQLKKKQDRRSARKDQAGVGGALGNSKERRVHARMDKQDTAADRSGRDLYSTGSRMDKIAKQGSSEVSNQSPNREDRARIKLAARTARKSLVPSRGRVRVDRERHM